MKKKTTDKKEGILLINKEMNMTSTHTLNALKKSCDISTIGHAGTLDPFATGLLIACVGKLTKMITYFQDLSKSYEAIILFGSKTDTDDRTGNILETSDKKVTLQEIKDSIGQFIGKITQTPPFYSAVKINGERAYNLARNNIAFEIKSRLVHVYNIDILDYNVEKQELKVNIHCSKGTYIRSIARDLGSVLGCLGHLKELCRVSIGDYHINKSIPYFKITASDIIPAQDFFTQFPSVKLKESAMRAVINGSSIQPSFIDSKTGIQDGYIPSYYKLFDPKNNFMGIVDNKTHKALYIKNR